MKFYVCSGKLKVVISGPHIQTAEQAACEAFLRYYKNGVKASPLTIVSERGFSYVEHEHEEDKVFDTCDILSKAGFKYER